MILVDTSVWVDHLASSDPAMIVLLEKGSVLMHSLIVGELAMGCMKERDLVLRGLGQLPSALVGKEAEVLHFIRERRLFGTGIGYIGAHLLVAARLTDGASLWTRDKRLHAVAAMLGLGASETAPRPN